MYIKVLQDGLMNDKIANPKTYTGNEFIAEYGIEAYDEIRDVFCDFHDDEKDENGHVDFLEIGLHVECWEN